MHPVMYARPGNISEALRMLSSPGAAILAGGTTLTDLMRCGVAHPDSLVDVSRLPELRTLTQVDDVLAIGSCVTMADLARHPAVTLDFPAVVDALLLAASAQIRNQATVGGNLLQGPRCVFYRDPLAECTRRDSRQPCSARSARSIVEPLLGADEDCIARYPGDLGVALVALDAEVEVQSARESRFVRVEHLLEPTGGPSSIGRDELITNIRIPAPLGTSAFVKRRERASFAFASASAAAALRVVDGSVVSARIVIGAQSTRPRRLTDAEGVVSGRALEESALVDAASAAVANLTGARHEVAWCRATVHQSLRLAAERHANAVT